MTYVPSAVAFLAGAVCLVLALLHVLRGNWRPQKTFFFLSVCIIAAIEILLGFLFLPPLIVLAVRGLHSYLIQ